MITMLGEMYIFIWITLFISIALIITNHSIKKFILTILVGAISNVILKTLINRPRPFETLQINSNILTNMSSFPSGHTMIFFVMIPYLSKTFPKIKIIIWTIAIFVGISRIYLGVHYFSDVIAGAIFGYLIGLMTLQIGEKNG
jgi:undecaprenyl-diphosphatase